MLFDIITLILIITGFTVYISWRDRPFSEKFELNEIYHHPLSDVETLIQPYKEIELPVSSIQLTMKEATIYAKPDYVLAKNPEKYLKIIEARSED